MHLRGRTQDRRARILLVEEGPDLVGTLRSILDERWDVTAVEDAFGAAHV